MEFPGVVALDRVSFCVSSGSIHGFLGPNGSGKTTSINIISGLLTPTAGEVILAPAGQGAKGIGLLPETPPLYPTMTVEQYLQFVANLYLTRKESTKAVEQTIDECGLRDCRKRIIAPLSKGYKQRVGIAQALIYSPAIVILDEPTVGLDPHSIDQIRALILSLKDRCTVILSSHNLNEVERLCDQVTILNQGSVVASGEMQEIKQNFKTTHQVVAQVKQWNQELSEELNQTLPNCQVLEYQQSAGRYQVTVSFDGSEQELSQLSLQLANRGQALFKIQEEEMSLEQIFKQATTQSGSRGGN
jgi:ABC-2 type transport system ATP-binding protein